MFIIQSADPCQRSLPDRVGAGGDRELPAQSRSPPASTLQGREHPWVPWYSSAKATSITAQGRSCTLHGDAKVPSACWTAVQT